jgi:dephospho-CoA kinase
MLKVGITGGIGSGKSTVCHLFKCLEIPVFNADNAGRNLLESDDAVIAQVKSILGEDVLINGKPDRKKIGGIVFNNPEKLTQLNAIIHPAVRRKYAEWTQEQTAPYLIYEAAILFETGLYKQLDSIVLVTTPEPLRIQRVMKRDGLTETSIRDRMKNQWSDKEKMKLASFIVVNDDGQALLPQVMTIHTVLLSKSS